MLRARTLVEGTREECSPGEVIEEPHAPEWRVAEVLGDKRSDLLDPPVTPRGWLRDVVRHQLDRGRCLVGPAELLLEQVKGLVSHLRQLDGVKRGALPASDLHLEHHALELGNLPHGKALAVDHRVRTLTEDYKNGWDRSLPPPRRGAVGEPDGDSRCPLCQDE